MIMKCVMFLLYLCVAAWHIEAHPDLDFITPCLYTDKKCLMSSALEAFSVMIKGIPKYNVASFAPLKVTNEINADKGEMKLRMKNIEVHNLDKCVIIDVKRKDRLLVEIELHCPFRLTADYLMKGKMAVIDVEGEDKCEVKTEKIVYKLVIKLKIVQKDGVDYYKVLGFDYSYDPVEKVDFNFQGLYNGDKAKSAVLKEFLDSNWKDVMLTFGDPVCKGIISQCVTNIAALLTAIPVCSLEVCP